MGQPAKDSLNRTLGRVHRAVAEREAAKIYQLSFWPDPVRGVPNELIRSVLFAAIQAQGRDYSTMPLQVRLPRDEVRAIKIVAAEREQTISEFMLACLK